MADPAAVEEPVDPYQNYDLRAVADEARDPRVRFAFEHPELLARFRAADVVAMDAKQASRRLGFLSVGFVLVAMLVASGGPVLEGLEHETHRILGYISAGLGVLGTIIGLSALRKNSARHKWLQARLQTEVMRLFHFHVMASRLPEIALVKGDPAKQAAYLAERSAAFDRLDAKILANPAAELERIGSGHDLADFDIGVPEASISGNEDPEVIELVLIIWRKLRLDWQLGYCKAKLAHKATGKRLSSRQTEHLFSTFSWIAIAVIIALHVSQFGADFLHLPVNWMEVIVVWTALSALAARAIEDGLKPQREVERYEQYKANIMVTAERLDAAKDLPSKLEIIRSFERVGLEEMRVFMRTHAKSRFLL